METKKSSKANLEKKKGIFFETGLVLALGVLLCAFSYKVNTKMAEAFITPPEGLVDEEIIPITPSMLKPPPPPPPKIRTEIELFILGTVHTLESVIISVNNCGLPSGP